MPIPITMTIFRNDKWFIEFLKFIQGLVKDLETPYRIGEYVPISKTGFFFGVIVRMTYMVRLQDQSRESIYFYASAVLFNKDVFTGSQGSLI